VTIRAQPLNGLDIGISGANGIALSPDGKVVMRAVTGRRSHGPVSDTVTEL
jgi:sugar lactone lactonase YvrE